MNSVQPRLRQKSVGVEKIDERVSQRGEGKRRTKVRSGQISVSVKMRSKSRRVASPPSYINPPGTP
jgi:hypothetical protein